MGHATADGPKHAGAGPGHAFKHFPAADYLSTILKTFFSHLTSPCGPNSAEVRRYTGDSIASGFIPSNIQILDP
jgi:hypothetical protein